MVIVIFIADFVACDNFINSLTCDGEKAMICIKIIDQVGTSGRSYCPEVPDGTPNNNCSSESVKKYIFEKCNGEKKNCTLFKRNTDISPYCERAFKFVVLSYDCGGYFIAFYKGYITSFQKRSTLPPPPLTKFLLSGGGSVLGQYPKGVGGLTSNVWIHFLKM